MTKREIKTHDADVISVIDGDTIVCRVDLDFDIQYTHPLRLAGINCPEMSTPEGLTARAFTVKWLTDHAAPYVLTTTGQGRDKYSRLLGRLIDHSGACLNDDLLSSGNAVVMKG